MLRRLIPAFLLASLAAACHISDPSQNTTETFSGSVSQTVSDIKNFSASKSGEISVTLTNLQPSLAVNQYIGVAFGLQASGGCSVISANTLGIVGTPAITSAIQPGSYCVQIFDAGFFKASTTYNYTMTISHP